MVNPPISYSLLADVLTIITDDVILQIRAQQTNL
jgi:hypothetical protein